VGGRTKIHLHIYDIKKTHCVFLFLNFVTTFYPPPPPPLHLWYPTLLELLNSAYFGVEGEVEGKNGYPPPANGPF